VFFFALLALALDRLNILALFHFHWVDDDQAVLWHAASDLAQGIFREPRFYGQNYSTWLESLVATPAIYLGVPHAVALPLASASLALLPFVLLVLVCLRRGAIELALGCLLVALCLPFQYAIISCMPRGFVPGIAIAAVALGIASLRSTATREFAIGALSALAVSANPNAAPLSVAVLVYVLARAWSESHLPRLLYPALGASLALAFHFWIQSFYRRNPDYAAHPPIKIHISFSAFEESLEGLANYTRYFSPVADFPVVLPVFLVLGLLLLMFRFSSRAHAFSYLAGLLTLVSALALEKVQDGSSSIYQPWARMFLGAPILWAWGLSTVQVRFPKRTPHLLCVLVVGIISLRLLRGPEAISEIVLAPEHQVQASRVERIKRECDRIRLLSKENDAEIVIFGVHAVTKILNYACPALWHLAGPETLFPPFERRTWKIRDEWLTARSRLLLYEFRPTRAFRGSSLVKHKRQLDLVPRILLVETTRQPIALTLAGFDYPLKRSRRSLQMLRRRGLIPSSRQD